jgi:oligopeptide transport system ATP-binding protein
MSSRESYILRTENLAKWFRARNMAVKRKASSVRAVDGVTIGVRRGETLGLVGESGCGKTTFGRTVMRLTKPTSGTVSFEGDDISTIKGSSLQPYRRKMQMVFQDPYASLDPRQDIRSAMMEPLRIHHLFSSKREAEGEIEQLIMKVGLNPDHLSRFPHEFSGGQRQRIAIAIALGVKPSFLVLDEPTSSLDVSVQAQVLGLLRSLQEELGLTYLFISHNLAVIRQMCDRTAVMYLGRVVELAPTKKLFESPKHPYTKALLDSVPLPDPTRRKRLAVIQGDVPRPVALPSGCRFRGRCPFATSKCASEDPPFVEVEEDHWLECHYDIDFESGARAELPAAFEKH